MRWLTAITLLVYLTYFVMFAVWVLLPRKFSKAWERILHPLEWLMALLFVVHVAGA